MTVSGKLMIVRRVSTFANFCDLVLFGGLTNKYKVMVWHEDLTIIHCLFFSHNYLDIITL